MMKIPWLKKKATTRNFASLIFWQNLNLEMNRRIENLVTKFKIKKEKQVATAYYEKLRFIQRNQKNIPYGNRTRVLAMKKQCPNL